MASLDQSSAKGPLSYILRYFPAVADALGNAPTDESALTELARWLMHWHVRNNKFALTPLYTLPGKIRERLSEAPNAGQFLQACELLHDSLTERLAIEPTARQLLGVAFSTENWQAVRDALKWWAGWIRAESELAPLVRTGAGVYLEALKRIPIAIREVGNIPQYVVTTSGDFDREMRPLWEGFEAAMWRLDFEERQSLRGPLGRLLDVDREKLKRQREQFEQNQQYAYPLEWLHDEYQPFRFEIAGHPDGFQDGRPVGATFWADLSVLVLLKQRAVQSALTVLNADLHDAISLLAPTAKPAPSKRPKKEATLHNLTSPEVQKILTELHLGSKYIKSGEWAAAFRALYMESILRGNAFDVHRWAVKEGYVNEKALSTIKKVWEEENSEARQFANSSQRLIFGEVSKSVKKTLITNQLNSNNK